MILKPNSRILSIIRLLNLYIQNPLPPIIQNIHFVQLVKDKFVDNSFKKFEDYLWHNKRVFYIFQALDSLLPGLWRDLISSGRQRHVQCKDVKYSFLDKLDDVSIPEGASSDEVRYLLYNRLSAS